MAALVNAALSSRLAIADRRSLRRGPVAPAPRAANLVVKAGWFDNNKDVDGRDPMCCLLYTSPSPRDRG